MWLAITEAHLLSRLSGTELTKLRSAALGNGQADPVQPVIDEVSAYVRGFVGRRYPLGEAGTIPQELLRAALALIVVELMSRVAGVVTDPKGERKSAADKAEELLQAVADGRFAVEAPVTQTTATISNPSPNVPDRPLRFSSGEQEGL